MIVLAELDCALAFYLYFCLNIGSVGAKPAGPALMPLFEVVSGVTNQCVNSSESQ